MSRVFWRGPLTDLVVSTLTSYMAAQTTPLVIGVGDGVAPKDGGWSGGQAGEGTFKPYLVVSAGTTQHGPADDPIKKQDSNWLSPYNVKYVGGSRAQADWAGDHARVALSALKNTKPYLGPDRWKVMRVQYSVLGALSRNDQMDPPFYEATDVVTLWLDLGP